MPHPAKGDSSTDAATRPGCGITAGSSYGEHTAGVKRQYRGCAGRVANGINVVYASYAAPSGHAVISARLYVPWDWADDSGRRAAAGIPQDLEF